MDPPLLASCSCRWWGHTLWCRARSYDHSPLQTVYPIILRVGTYVAAYRRVFFFSYCWLFSRDSTLRMTQRKRGLPNALVLREATDEEGMVDAWSTCSIHNLDGGRQLSRSTEIHIGVLHGNSLRVRNLWSHWSKHHIPGLDHQSSNPTPIEVSIHSSVHSGDSYVVTHTTLEVTREIPVSMIRHVHNGHLVAQTLELIAELVLIRQIVLGDHIQIAWISLFQILWNTCKSQSYSCFGYIRFNIPDSLSD